MNLNDNTVGAIGRTAGQHRSAAALMPIMAVVFIAYLVIGLAMPVLPLHVHLDLGLSTFVVGLVSGSQFAASFFSRMWAWGKQSLKPPSIPQPEATTQSSIASSTTHTASTSKERASESKSNPLQINRSLDLLIPQRHHQIDPCD